MKNLEKTKNFMIFFLVYQFSLSTLKTVVFNVLMLGFLSSRHSKMMLLPVGIQGKNTDGPPNL